MEHLKNSSRAIRENARPYPLSDEGDGAYTFVTDNGIKYVIRYKEGPLPEDLKNEGFEISEFEFLAEQGKKLVRDEKISATAVKSLKDYFINPKKVAVYVCDEEGEKRRGQFRQKLFQDWHKEMGEGFGLYQFEPVIETDLGDYELYAGVIYRADCPNVDTILPIIAQSATEAIIEKYFE